MNWLRLVRDVVLIFFVLLMMSTKISQSWDYWWVALVGTVFLMLPDLIGLRRKEDSQK
ncbi:hypothetical protein [Arcanobacterium haemolyticum]|uniref:Uncharacterized protein n=1 Tax=Arcanobacterium haemolyticum (strain ATCC 9345 / DSM 20595 / CCM 5947 / CCUG 17215 / LMG 16163 / NBRC 15585 / NCTC 8452 / 11018) TaxID=644284 RepID=D7BKQ3_ARCHD|nr:hypothetical protein [Arcanobacterium haemolyticum]ADH93233.1 hypothetical protein Arch_1540 [Arcanobacterium haemolyticum DSM 20595]SQH27995.1 Uncharacterised protein [Arcanobacterium haemolyticum]